MFCCYLKTLHGIPASAWAQLVRSSYVARTVFGTAIGCAMGGVNSEVSTVYLQGAFNVWPLYVPQTPAASEVELVLALSQALSVITNQTTPPLIYEVNKMLFQLSGGRNWRAFLYLLQKAITPSEWTTCVAIWQVEQIDVTPAEQALARNSLDLNADVVPFIKWMNLVIDKTTSTIYHQTLVNGAITRAEVAIADIPTVIDVLLTACWVGLGHQTVDYLAPMHSVIFPVLCSGPNVSVQKLIRSCRKILDELDISDNVQFFDRAGAEAWKGVCRLLAPHGHAEQISMRVRVVADFMTSIWMKIFAERMLYFGMTTVMLIAIAIKFFPKAGWTNFFSAPQPPYTPENCGIITTRLMEYVAFVQRVSQISTLPFTVQQYTEAPDDQKINYLLQAWGAIRPVQTNAEWQRQGADVLRLLAEAMENPYRMYEGQAGQSSIIADVALYAFLLLKDVAHQSTLERYKNNYREKAVYGAEIETLVRNYSLVNSDLPQSHGVMDNAWGILSGLINRLVDYQDGPPPSPLIDMPSVQASVLQEAHDTVGSLGAQNLAEVLPPSTSHVEVGLPNISVNPTIVTPMQQHTREPGTVTRASHRQPKEVSLTKLVEETPKKGTSSREGKS